MNQQQIKPRLPLGLLLFALLLTLYKAVTLTSSIGASWLTLVLLIALDLFFIALLMGIAIVLSLVKARLIRRLLRLLLILMTAIYLLDSFVLLALDEHPNLFDIGRYAPELGVVLSFFDYRAYIAIALWMVSIFLAWPVTTAVKKFSSFLLFITLLCGGAGAYYAPEPLTRYAMLSPAAVVESIRPQTLATIYSAEQMAFYAGLKTSAVEFLPDKPDIILLVVESLSSINSKKISGQGDLLARFDELAGKGVLFTHFFANHQASEGGIISLLSGVPPVHFPTATPYMFDEFAQQPSVLAGYRQYGYFTEFLTNAELAFIGLDHYLAGLGIDRARGRDEVDSLRLAPRIVQAAPADDVLYTEAISRIRSLMPAAQPFLLVLATTSTHLPYTHPKGGPDTARAVWDWSLQQLTTFVEQLSREGYFEHGILLITGDHRQMRPLTTVESEKYGGSARARVPLLVIGNDYRRGVMDERFFQQADLLRMLARIERPGAPLSPQPIWVERYNRKYGRKELIDRLSVFDESDGGRKEYRLKLVGDRIQWLDDKPGFSREVEIKIHTQRSQHQKNRARRTDE